MARSTNNNVVSGLRGMVGKLVFRTVRGRTIVSSRTCPPQYQSKRQREHRIRFRQAAKRARAALLDPNTKKHYTFKARKLNLPNAYTAALTDFMRKPSLDTVCYKPNHGDLFITATKKDFAISAVEVAITNTQGVPLITTAAEKDQHKHQWKARLPIDLETHERRTHILLSGNRYRQRLHRRNCTQSNRSFGTDFKTGNAGLDPVAGTSVRMMTFQGTRSK